MTLQVVRGSDLIRIAGVMAQGIALRSMVAAIADPTIHEPTTDPDDDTEAEVPDVKEDPVPE